MVSKPFQRPFSLATRLTFFISLATIAAFFAFAWIMIHSVKVHFAEQDINDLKEISATLERVLNHPDETQARRLMTLEDIVSGYSNVLISLADSQGKTVYHSPVRPISASLRVTPYPIKTRGAARCISFPARRL
ncbi:sensor kinase CusS [Escherichia coli]|uniref:Sensor kinase CusS n=1 Tax=Escherichia coli TaxID=562 RepID=A0A376X529_ECOLX|nr:sensor kinase CusS [Escherichia coli]